MDQFRHQLQHDVCLLKKDLNACVLEEIGIHRADLVKERCFGCSVDHPSQIQHDMCCMTSPEEQIELLTEDALLRVNADEVWNKWHLSLEYREYLAAFLLWKTFKDRHARYLSDTNSTWEDRWIQKQKEELAKQRNEYV